MQEILNMQKLHTLVDLPKIRKKIWKEGVLE